MGDATEQHSMGDDSGHTVREMSLGTHITGCFLEGIAVGTRNAGTRVVCEDALEELV